MVRILTEEDIATVLELDELLSVVEDALRKQDRGAVERPERPHFSVGIDSDGGSPAGTGLTMPAYIHGNDTYATKLASVHPGNSERDLPTITAQIALTDATTGQPVAYMAGTAITNARTGCIGGLSARALSDSPVTVGVIGAGRQARWQTRAIAAVMEVTKVRIYSPSESKTDCAADLRQFGIETEAAETATEAARNADVVVTATTAEDPVISTDALAPDTAVVAIGAYSSEMQELEPATLSGASEVFADVPTEAAATGDVRATDLTTDDLRGLSAAMDERPREGRRVVLSVGSAVFDAAAAAHVHDRAVAENVGRVIDL